MQAPPRPQNPRDVLITGIGLLSALGEGAAAHWQALEAGNIRPRPDSARFAPYTVQPLGEIDWNRQIPKRGDQRQMETWQRIGTYTAGLALEDAGLKTDEALCAETDMVVAAGGGERDEAVDNTILAASAARNDRSVLLNEKLTTELRPTLFLAQLSNLLAGNISIVHKVTGSSRTFMGEESAGVAAVETAAARIRAGQSRRVLVGGAYNGEHPDMLLAYELGGFLHRGAWRPVWQRGASEGGGIVLGSGGAFLVLESRESAEARGAKVYAKVEAVASSRTRRDREDLAQALAVLFRGVAPNGPGELAIISAASGAHAATAAERTFLDRLGTRPVRGFTTATGHLKEAQFPFAIGLAALAMHRRSLFPPLDPEAEPDAEGAPDALLAVAVGYHRFEGMALVSPS